MVQPLKTKPPKLISFQMCLILQKKVLLSPKPNKNVSVPKLREMEYIECKDWSKISKLNLKTFQAQERTNKE